MDYYRELPFEELKPGELTKVVELLLERLSIRIMVEETPDYRVLELQRKD